MPEYKIIEISDSNILSLKAMADESSAEGDTFVQKTIDEWLSGKNNFSKPSEKLWGLVIDEELVGLGGLNQDPYLEDETVGRVRHVYIMRKYRGLGLSKVLMQIILDRARKYFKSLRLSTKNPIAASLYESLGFERVSEHKATHIIKKLN